MKTVEEHLTGILDVVRPLEPLELHLLEAQGLVLAADVTATAPLPSFDNSAMDGYAVRLADLSGVSEAQPAVLRVIGDVPAGSTADVPVTSGCCVRVMTGAPVPDGTEAVVPIEWTDQGEPTVRVRREPTPGQYVRHAGDDVLAGQTVLRAGTTLGPRQIALLAALGQDRVAARPHPRVVVVSTGSELVEPGTPPAPGQIADANGYALAAAAQAAGAVAYRVGIVPDDAKSVLDTIEDQLIRADLVVTSGGVSAGAYDVVKEVLSGLGTVSFDKVAMQPGMPQGFGTVGPDRVPIFTLPGNPVSAYVSFELFVRPAIQVMLGRTRADGGESHTAVCTAGFDSPAGRRQYARGRLTPAGDDGARAARVTPVGGAGSHLLGGLAGADCLIVVPEDVTAVRTGDHVEVMPLDQP